MLATAPDVDAPVSAITDSGHEHPPAPAPPTTYDGPRRSRVWTTSNAAQARACAVTHPVAFGLRLAWPPGLRQRCRTLTSSRQRVTAEAPVPTLGSAANGRPPTSLLLAVAGQGATRIPGSVRPGWDTPGACRVGGSRQPVPDRTPRSPVGDHHHRAGRRPGRAPRACSPRSATSACR
jgi:hypothetical protein